MASWKCEKPVLIYVVHYETVIYSVFFELMHLWNLFDILYLLVVTAKVTHCLIFSILSGEEGQDAGGLLREWYIIISREIFNPMYALFCTSPGDRVTYTINPSSHCNSNHLSYFKFVGRIIAKAVFDNKLLECYFTRSFYKHILGVLVKWVLIVVQPRISFTIFRWFA